MDQRVLEPEVMDDPSLDAAAHEAALRGLRRLNHLSGAATAIFRAIRDLCATKDQPLRILDIATGGGDVPIALHRLALRRGCHLEIHGCDISPVAVRFARAQAERAAVPAEFFILDALRDPLPGGFDVVMCSLFLHHLSDGQALRLLAKMAAAAHRRVVINDLRRNRFALATVWVATRLVTRCRVVHTDGPRSVRAAFSLAEARELAHRAGLDGAVIRPDFPCRFIMRWDKR